jgi:hypothetical protein
MSKSKSKSKSKEKSKKINNNTNNKNISVDTSSDSSNMFSVKYKPVSKDEHEIFMNELYDANKSIMNPNEKAFDFTSINKYDSIFKYKHGNILQKQNGSLVNGWPFFFLFLSFAFYSKKLYYLIYFFLK